MPADEFLYESQWQCWPAFDGQYYWMAAPDFRATVLTRAYRGSSRENDWVQIIGDSIHGYNTGPRAKELPDKYSWALWSPTFLPEADEEGFDWFDEPSLEGDAHYWVLSRANRCFHNVIFMDSKTGLVKPVGFNRDQFFPLIELFAMFEKDEHVYTPIPRPRNPYFAPTNSRDAMRYQLPKAPVWELPGISPEEFIKEPCRSDNVVLEILA